MSWDPGCFRPWLTVEAGNELQEAGSSFARDVCTKYTPIHHQHIMLDSIEGIPRYTTLRDLYKGRSNPEQPWITTCCQLLARCFDVKMLESASLHENETR